MKKLLLSFTALLLFAGITYQTQASQQNTPMDECELAYQVAYNRAFQDTYVETGNMLHADADGINAGLDAWFECYGIF